MTKRKQDAEKKAIEEEAAAEVREAIRAHDEINTTIRESTRAAADDEQWASAKFSTEEFRAHIPQQPRTFWQRFKSWIYD